MLVAIPGDARPMIMKVLSLRLELHVFVGPRERKPGDEPEPRLLDPWPEAAHRGELPDRGEHRLLVHELLDPVQGRLAALAVELRRLLPEEPVDVGIAAVDVSAAGHDEGFEAGWRVAERGARAQHEILECFLDLSLVVRRALERGKLQAKARPPQMLGPGPGDARGDGRQ